MNRILRLAGDVFWSAMIVLGLLIVAYFVLRMVGRLGGPFATASSAAARLSTPPGA